MKNLCLIRHAKSSWDHPELGDFDRPLNKRGERNAPLMGDVLAKDGFRPELIVSSPASRAYTTACVIAGKIGYGADQICTDRNIYEADLDTLMRVMAGWDDGFESVALVGHNPGMTWLANHLTGARIGNIPTCGIVLVKLQANRWADVTGRSGYQSAFIYPRLYDTG